MIPLVFLYIYLKTDKIPSSVWLSCVVYLALFTSVPSFEHMHTPSLSCLAPVRQLTTEPPNERNKNGPLKSLETSYLQKINSTQTG